MRSKCSSPNMCSYRSLVWLLLIQILMTVVDATFMPRWKNQLLQHKQWKGHYMFNGTAHGCSMVVHSVQSDDNGVAVVSLSADNTKLDMTVHSSDDIRIIFKEETIYNPGDHFYDGFQFVVELLRYGKMHVFLGNITRPASKSSTVWLQPEGTSGTNHMESSNLSVGLAVGISLFIFVVCVVIGIVILRWAIRSGYLRHVAMSYKTFRNPDTSTEAPVSFSNSKDNIQQDVDMHI